jgi:hypothetical protein
LFPFHGSGKSKEREMLGIRKLLDGPSRLWSVIV